jgi:hypothetical protein
MRGTAFLPNFLTASFFLAASGLWAQVPAPPRAGDVVPIFKFHKRTADLQPLPEPVKLQVTAFLEGLKAGEAGVRPAYEALLRGSRLAERPENVEILVTRTIAAFQAFGPVLEYDHYDTQKVMGRLYAVDFVTWHTAQPLQWRFVYYRPVDAWTLIDVRVSDVVEDLLE